ncbi:MAG TPA: DUF6134 family protein [Alphaproteobacteria bacterium]|nr:DUF6134 family protein [Alphaproteobacteria bacterium]
MAVLAKMLTSRELLGAVAICALLAAGPSAAAFQQRYTYRVQDRFYGAIGTYSNTVEKSRDATTITTEAHIEVSVLGITLYRQDVSRIERQVGDRLIYFHGITTENGKSIEVDGRADGEHFIVTSPSGKVTAPGTIRSVSPWSAGRLRGDMVLMPDTGLVTKIVASGGEETSITIDGAATRVRRYQIDTVDGRERYEVWMDDKATPVMFSIQDSEGTVTFTLLTFCEELACSE